MSLRILDIHSYLPRLNTQQSTAFLPKQAQTFNIYLQEFNESAHSSLCDPEEGQAARRYAEPNS